MFDNQKEPELSGQLDPKVASQMLSNIFSACDYEENIVPLEVMSSCSNYRRERNYIQRAVIIAILVILLLMPLMFIIPQITLTRVEDIPGRPVIMVDYDSLLPVQHISAVIDNYSVSIEAGENGGFRILPDRNGALSIKITLINHQSAEETFQVEGVDRNPPKLVRSELHDDLLTIYFEDESGELLYDAAYAKNNRGDTVKPVDYDPDRMSITFRYPGEALNIFVQDKFQNMLQLILTVR